MVKFISKDHKYTSEDGTKWLSVTSLIKKFQEHFDADSIALKSSKNKKSKWYGMTPKEIKKCWEDISMTAIELGNWYHNEQERILCSTDTIERDGIPCKITIPIFIDDEKIAPDQILENNHIYPEHFCFLKSAGVCGQSDLVEVRDNKVYIIDYKSNKDLTLSGYKNWQGISKKLLKPLHHLDDCKLTIYTLQLSLYMYMILKHNPLFKVGTLKIHHIIFKEIDRDRLGNPVYGRDSNNDPIVERVDIIEVPYLKKEIMTILKTLDENSCSS